MNINRTHANVGGFLRRISSFSSTTALPARTKTVRSAEAGLKRAMCANRGRAYSTAICSASRDMQAPLSPVRGKRHEMLKSAVQS